MLLCPSFFDSRRDGIGRVSGAFHEAARRLDGVSSEIWSANEASGAEGQMEGRCFSRNYTNMALAGLCGDLPDPLPGRRVLTMHMGLSPVGRLIARRRKVPHAVFLHGVECWCPLKWRARWGLQSADWLYFNSNYTRERFLKNNPWAASLRHLVIPLGVPIASMKSESHGADVGEAANALSFKDHLRVLSVGRMSKADFYEDFRDGEGLYKGFNQLILAVGMVARSGYSVSLDIVGDGDARSDLERWLDSHEEEKRFVRFLGKVSDERLRQAYRESDVFCLPSEGEGFGLVFAEAMAHGLPCVCVNAGAAPEVVLDGRVGLVAKPRDVQDLADKLVQLAADPALRERLGRAARARAEELYSYEHFLSRIQNALERMGK